MKRLFLLKRLGFRKSGTSRSAIAPPQEGCWCEDKSLPVCGPCKPEAERDRYLNALRGIYGVVTTPTQRLNEQPAAQMVAGIIEKIEGWGDVDGRFR